MWWKVLLGIGGAAVIVVVVLIFVVCYLTSGNHWENG